LEIKNINVHSYDYLEFGRPLGLIKLTLRRPYSFNNGGNEFPLYPDLVFEYASFENIYGTSGTVIYFDQIL